MCRQTRLTCYNCCIQRLIYNYIDISRQVNYFFLNPNFQVVNDYFAKSAFGDIAAASRWVFGPALFVGWTAMVLSVIGGLVMGCGSFSESNPVSRYQRNSVRQVGRLGRSITQSFRRGRDSVPLRKKREYDDDQYVQAKICLWALYFLLRVEDLS